MPKWTSYLNILLRPRVILGIYVLLALITTLQGVLLGSYIFKMPEKAPPGHDIVNNLETMRLYVGSKITFYNNYVIFKQSWFHLLNGENLYIIYPKEYWDLYKYSPTFALFMAPFAYLPDFLSLFVWTLLNTVVLFVAVNSLPFTVKQKGLFLLFIIEELLTSIQNFQSNALLAGLLILAYSHMENRKMHWAALMLVIATFIKIYGGIGFCLFLFYPGKMKAFSWSLLWTIICVLAPLIVTPPQTLLWQYHNWANMLAADQSTSYGLSVMGWLHSWFGLNSGKNIIMLTGIGLLVVPFLRVSLYKTAVYRLWVLAYILIWVIVFNHKSESPTFIIAVCGVCIWYFSEVPSVWRNVLLWMVFIFTSLSVTDFIPTVIKDYFFVPYTIKAVPCIILFAIILFQLIKIKKPITASM